MAADTMDKESRVEQACTAAEEFAKIYYSTLDKSRHNLQRLYMENACLVWNGNGVAGNEAIANFYKNLPISETSLHCLDSQPILEPSVHGQPTILVTAAGFIKHEDKPTTPFQQNFVLTVQGTVWKIVTDCFRFQETV